MQNLNNNPFDASESLIAHYTNQTLGFDPLAKRLKTKWISPNAEEQTAIVNHVKEVFTHLVNLQPKEDWEREAKCVRIGRFVNGLATVERNHEGTYSNYSVLLSGVKEFLVTAKNKAEEQVLLSYRAGALLHLDSQGRLQLEIPRDYVSPENSLIKINETEENDLAKKLISIVNNQNYKSDTQKTMLQKLEELQITAEQLNYRSLSNSLKTFALGYKKKLDLEYEAAELIKKLDRDYSEFKLLPDAQAFETPYYQRSILTIEQLLPRLKSIAIPNNPQMVELNNLISTFESYPARIIAQYTSKVIQHIKTQNRILNTKTDAFKNFSETFSLLVNYKPTYYTLYVDKNGVLQYPSYPTVLSFDALAVLTKIQHQVDSFLKELGRSHFPKKDLLKLGKEISQGLELIEKDYTKNNKDFAAKVSQLRKTLDDSLVSQANNLQHQIHDLAIDNRTSIYQFLALQAEYPVDIMLSVFSNHFGLALTEHVFSNYTSRKTTLSYEEVRGLLFAVAADVRVSDLRWKYEQSSLRNEKPFEQLSQDELNVLLNSFRKTPTGQNLLDYFNIPLTWDKHNVTSEFLATLPSDTIEACNRANAIQVLADIESSHMWHGKRAIRMSQAQMYENLEKIFQDPFKADLFHSDYYLSFLTIASTFFALMQDCKGNPDRIQARMPALIARIEQILKNPPKEYQNKHLDKYKQQLNKLLQAMKTATEQPDINPAILFNDFLVHPLANNKQDTLKIHEHTRPTEYLARKVGYWNKYFLENTAMYKSYPLRGNQNLRVGTIFHHQEGSSVVLYEVKQCTINGGLVCQICAPINTLPYKEKGLPIPLKVVFQGTIIQNASYSRDYAITRPGHNEWFKEGFGLFSGQLSQALTNEIEKHGKNTTFHVEMTGHSLGGSDTQNAAAELAQAFLKIEGFANHFDGVKIVTFNRAGVPVNTIEKFNEAFKHKHHNKLDMIIHAVVKDDIVQVSGEQTLGANLEAPSKCFHLEKNSTKGNGEMDLHCDIAHGNSATQCGTIYPIRLLDPVHDKDAIDRYLTTFAGGTAAFAGHVVNVVRRNPVVQAAATVAASSTMIVFGGVLLTAKAAQKNSGKNKDESDEDNEVKRSAGNALISAGIATAGAGFAKATTQYSTGTQILEGND